MPDLSHTPSFKYYRSPRVQPVWAIQWTPWRENAGWCVGCTPGGADTKVFGLDYGSDVPNASGLDYADVLETHTEGMG